jgi:hypothetical protein
MEITKDFGTWNDRRYGRPWGAVVTFDAANKAQYDFKAGSFLGERGSGEVVLICNPGDVVAFGQKDYRKTRGTENDWYIVLADGTLEETTKGAALKYWKSQKENKITHNQAMELRLALDNLSQLIPDGADKIASAIESVYSAVSDAEEND